MDNPQLDSALREAIYDELRQRYGDRLARVVLFGSYARGTATPESDLDVLVVLHGDVDRHEENWRLSEVVLDLLEKHGQYVSFLVLSQQEYETADWPLLVNVREEGLPL